ncbi:MAG: right-handed parallel beta-helix repeat-containing protein [Phycisphaeraceae bacterium]
MTLRKLLTRATVLAAAAIAVPAVAEVPDQFPHQALPTGQVELEGQQWNIDARQAEIVPSDSDETAELDLEPTRASHLRFLHTFRAGPALEDYRKQVALAHRKLELPPEYPTVLRYQVTYEDGETLDIPVRFGESIQEWYRVHGVGPMLWAKPAWQHELAEKSGEKAVLYAMTWPNPRPDKQITAVKARGGAREELGETTVLDVAADQNEPTGRYLYVNRKPVGSDDHPGTLDKPFGTLQKAVDAAKAGDTIFIRGGRYHLDDQIQINKSGEEGKRLTVTAYPGETPVFEAYGVHYDATIWPYAEGAPREGRPHTQHDTGAIDANTDGYLRIQGLSVRNSPRAGISVYGGEQVDVNFNTTYRSFSMGIITHGNDELRILGNRVIRPHSISMVTDKATGETQSDDHLDQEGVDLSNNDGFEVAWNEVSGGGKEAIDCISVQNGRIHHNYVHSSLNGIYIDSWSEPIVGLEIDHNFIHNAYAGVPLATEGSNELDDFDIHHNIVIDSKSMGIVVSEATYKAEPSPVHHIRVFNNTIDRSGYHAQGIDWNSAGIQVSGFKDNPRFNNVDVINNIVTNSAQVPMSSVYKDKLDQHDIRFSHNLLHPAEDQTLDRFHGDRLNMLLGENPVTQPPQYVNPVQGDYRLQAGSPAIEAGTDGGDLGALPYGSAWRPGFDWQGKVTAFYQGDTNWTPVDIPREKFTVYRNHLQRPSWFQINRYGADFQNLPEGDQSFAGATFYIEPDSSIRPNILVLEGRGSESRAKQIEGIPVGRKADRLAFLQNFHPGWGMKELSRDEQKGLQLFHYQVNYADGSTAEIPVIWQRHVDHWLGGPLKDLPEAELAWSQTVQKKRGRSAQLRLYKQTWENPKPDVAIESIDLVRDGEEKLGGAAVFAISAGETIE